MTSSLLATPARFNAAFLLLRLVVGLVFVVHGAQKVFVYGLNGVIGGFTQMGAPLPVISGPLVAGIELIGGLALIAGLFTRYAGVALAAVMAGAIVLVHLAGGFFVPAGVEFVLTLMVASLSLALTGAGEWSVDAALANRRGARSQTSTATAAARPTRRAA